MSVGNKSKHKCKTYELYIKNRWFLYKEMVLTVVDWKNNAQHKSYELCFIGAKWKL